LGNKRSHGITSVSKKCHMVFDRHQIWFWIRFFCSSHFSKKKPFSLNNKKKSFTPSNTSDDLFWFTYEILFINKLFCLFLSMSGQFLEKLHIPISNICRHVGYIWVKTFKMIFFALFCFVLFFAFGFRPFLWLHEVEQLELHLQPAQNGNVSSFVLLFTEINDRNRVCHQQYFPNFSKSWILCNIYVHLTEPEPNISNSWKVFSGN